MSPRASRNRLIGGGHALGHTEIDAEHFAIADCWLEVTRCAPLALQFQIARLRKLMRNHFDHEAMLVNAAGSPFCSCHKREHEFLLSLCDKAYSLSRNNWRSARALLRGTLPGLVRQHIISMDQIAVLIINTTGDRTSVCPHGC